jgi:hypothetical protein
VTILANIRWPKPTHCDFPTNGNGRSIVRCKEQPGAGTKHPGWGRCIKHGGHSPVTTGAGGIEVSGLPVPEAFRA